MYQIQVNEHSYNLNMFIILNKTNNKALIPGSDIEFDFTVILVHILYKRKQVMSY